MPAASYTVTRAIWPLWRWDVRTNDGASRGGFGMTKRGARFAARSEMRRARPVWSPSPSAPPPRRALSRRLIPRLVHQVALDCVLPPEILRNLEDIRASNPTWECRLYDAAAASTFILDHFGRRMLDTWERINPDYGAARADLLRYLLLYQGGGVYLDLKSRALRPLDEVILPHDRFLLAQWDNGPGMKFEGWGLHDEVRLTQGGEYQQWFIIAAPGHPFLKAVIERVVRNINGYIPALHGAGRMGVLRTTGPIPYTLAIRRLRKSCAYRMVRSDDDLGLEYSIYLDLDHTSKSATHYSQATTPVAKVAAAQALISSVLQTAKAMRRRIGGVATLSPRGRQADSRQENTVLVDRGTPLGLIAPDSKLRQTEFAEDALR